MRRPTVVAGLPTVPHPDHRVSREARMERPSVLPRAALGHWLKGQLMIARKHQWTLLVAGLAALASFMTPHRARADAVTIDTVPIGNPGNAADTRYDPAGFSSVASAYHIGKYEVT